MGWIDEWFQELEDPNVLDMVEGASAETLASLDPPPGLKLWLEQNGLGLIPLVKERYYETDTPIAEVLAFQSKSEAPPMAVTPQVRDTVQFKTSSGVVGQGLVLEIDGDGWVLIEMSPGRLTGANTSAGDTITVIPSR